MPGAQKETKAFNENYEDYLLKRISQSDFG
jgi:hypothetical protein